MRLTLRTLLAYLDDILDPADKESLGQKIETSDFAGDLILRTRDTTRRLRLSAPQVTGTGMGLDPNTVAEYLDNALPPDQVGDFERICLESDMHLAEVASCHHVLTMVLGSPADIDPAARTRMYSIPLEASTRCQLRVEPAHTARVAEVPLPPAASAVTPAAPTERRDKPTVYAKPEIPEYLRASGWSRSRVLVSAVGILLLAGIPMYLVKDLTGWFGGAAEEAAIV
ncbi:MAG: hypothetical protein L0Z07_04115, partial [Planctomycetes bacterium]|nr:hypothetical protein [Planctomycetota bacterium]